MGSTSTDASNAWIPDGPVIEGAQSGPLRGLTFAAKDLYDVRCRLPMQASHIHHAAPPALKVCMQQCAARHTRTQPRMLCMRRLRAM